MCVRVRMQSRPNYHDAQETHRVNFHKIHNKYGQFNIELNNKKQSSEMMREFCASDEPSDGSQTVGVRKAMDTV